MFVYCLADFFNLRLWPTGRPATFADIRDGLDELTGTAISRTPSAGEITIRLYGGWHGDVPHTQIGLRDMVTRAIEQAPKRLSRTRIRLELAESPIWDKSIRLLRSVRVSQMNNLHAEITSSLACLDPAACSLDSFATWCQGSCPTSGCRVQLATVARTRGQKMVDTLITADALVIARDQLADVVILASDDADMIPALLALSVSPLQVVHLIRSKPSSNYYRGILEREGLTIHEW